MIRITSPWFVVGLELHKDSVRVSRAAPVVKYMTGWTLAQVSAYCRKRHWKMEYRNG